MRPIRKTAVILAPAALVLAACGTSPTVSSSPATESPSQSSTAAGVSTQAPNQGSSPSNPATSGTQSTNGPGAKVAGQIGCSNPRSSSGSLATATTVYCTDGERGYVLSVFGSKGQLNVQFKKIEKSVEETGETITIMIGPDWILRGAEAQQIGPKIEATAGAAGGRVVSFTDSGLANP